MKRIKKRLQLDLQTVRNLQRPLADELAQVVGGGGGGIGGGGNNTLKGTSGCKTCID